MTFEFILHICNRGHFQSILDTVFSSSRDIMTVCVRTFQFSNGGGSNISIITNKTVIYLVLLVGHGRSIAVHVYNLGINLHAMLGMVLTNCPNIVNTGCMYLQ